MWTQRTGRQFQVRIIMETRELMVGDFVQARSGKVWKLILREDRLLYQSKSERDGKMIYVYLPANGIEMEGIPLNEEIVKANGFRYDENYNCYFTTGLALHFEPKSGEFSILIVGGGFYEIKYVHQLQLVLRLCERADLARDFNV